jgi:two-component system, cell cycle sensor histidine kinase and response regulator CckA
MFSEPPSSASPVEINDVFDDLIEGCQMIDFEWRYTYVNASAARHGRVRVEDLLGRTMMEVYPGIEGAPLFGLLSKCMTERAPQEVENLFTYSDGSFAWFQLKIRPIPGGIFVLSVDITARKSAEVALQDSESKHASLLEDLDVVVFSTDANGLITYMSPAFSRLYPVDPARVIGQPLTDFAHPDDCERLNDALHQALSGDVSPCEFRVVSNNHRWRYLRFQCRAAHSGADVGLQGFLIDVTQQRQAEDHLFHAQKLEAVGRLASGVAHDFNNLLSVIINYTAFAIETLAADDPIRNDLCEVHAAGERAANLTRQLLTFSRKQPTAPTIINPSEIIHSLNGMLRRIIGEDILISLFLDPNLWHISIDPGHLEQAIANLCVNARDAMANGGKITIEATNVTIDEPHLDSLIVAQAGDYVQISITDTGCGMDTQTLKMIFEPFFTTKERGKGTGLGLSTVYGIIKQHNGYIWPYSEVNRGTTFKLYFPRSYDPLTPRRSESHAIHTGTETILVIEDDVAVSDLVRRILSSAGYTVVAAQNAQDALALCVSHDRKLSLLLTDVIMPHISGQEVASVLLSMCPHLRVLYMSGYADHAAIHHGVISPLMHFISKPFTAASLTRKVREVLDEVIVPTSGHRSGVQPAEASPPTFPRSLSQRLNPSKDS